MRATVDYWVNALDGQPFFYVNQAVDHVLVQALREDVLPWLQANVPVSAEHQARLETDPRTPRFTVIFDREGYSRTCLWSCVRSGSRRSPTIAIRKGSGRRRS